MKNLQRIEALILKVQAFYDAAETPEQKKEADYTLKCMSSLAMAVIDKKPIFGVEPWHVINEDVPLGCPGEFLLRLKDSGGEALPPYPAIITFYQNGMTADIDTILFLCALSQFENSDEGQISINVSARSLRDADFIRAVLGRIEEMDFAPDKKIIVEVHETTPELKMSKDVLALFRKCGVMFAIDDVGLGMGDVMRLAEFEDIADFIKLDRHSVCAKPEDANSLDHVISFITSMLPEATLVAEGVKSADHAAQLHEQHPQIKYVQGLYLPESRDEFAREWEEEHVKQSV